MGEPARPTPPEPAPELPEPRQRRAEARRARAEARAAIAPHVRELRLWQRFHVKLSLAYGGMVSVMMGVLCFALYQHSASTEFRSLQDRMRAIALTAAVKVDGKKALRVAENADLDDTYYRRLVTRFEKLVNDDPDVTSIYVFVPVPDRPGWFKFAADYVRSGTPGRPGQLYDGTRARKLEAGLVSAQVEDQPYTDEWGTLISAYAPVMTRDGQPVGVLGVDVELTRVDAHKRQVLGLSLAVLLASAVVLAVIAWVVARNVREPLGRIIAAAAQIARGRYDARVGVDRRDEFGILGHHFDEMARGLEEREHIRRTLGRYMSEDVARHILEGDAAQLGGEEREVTVLFSDLRGYSTISEPLSPEQVVSLLNEYLAAMNAVIDRHSGVVIEFLGDAILAVFGAPVALDDHAEKAVRCAMEMREALDDLNGEWEERGLATLWKERGLERFGARIGVHTGRVVAGNLGSRTRMKYAVIGDAVNLASRVENLNGQLGTDILVTQAAYERCSEETRAHGQDRGEHLVKGRAQPVRVWKF